MKLNKSSYEFNKNTLLDSIDLEYGLVRKLMSKEEIKLANILVKKGILYKGTSDDKQKLFVII